MARKARATVRAAADKAREALLASAGKIDTEDDRLGDLVLYDLVSGFRKSVRAVSAVFAAHGLEPKEVLPMPPDWGVAFGRALEQVSARIRVQGYKLIPAKDGPKGERRIAVVAVHANKTVTTKDLATICCPTSKDDAPPFVERGEDRTARKFAREVVEATEAMYQVYTTDDIRVAVVEHIDRWFGLPLRKQPPYVAYWVPAAGSKEIRNLREAVEECGAGEIELFTGYGSDRESKRAIVNTVNKGLESQLNEFKADVQTYLDKDAISTRVSTMEELIEESKRLRERAGLYRSILGAAVESVDSQYKAVEKKVKKHLGIVEDAHAEVA